MLYWQRFNIFLLCFFAISVSLGAALVSISKALVILSFILYIICTKPWKYLLAKQLGSTSIEQQPFQGSPQAVEM